MASIQKLAYLVFDDQVPAECFGNEAVFFADKLSGVITSGAYGYRVGPQYCLCLS